MDKVTQDLGIWIRQYRKKMGITEKSLALTSGIGLRFIIDLEKGKPTCKIGKALLVFRTLASNIGVSSRNDFRYLKR